MNKTRSSPRLISLVGRSNSGKTTLLTKLIPRFKKLGLKIGTIKNTHHHVDFDDQGKDSWKHAQAGSSRVMVTSGKKMAVYADAPKLQTVKKLAEEWFQGFDLVFSEGFKNEDCFKIEVCRKANQKSPLHLDPIYKISGVIGDLPPEMDIPFFPFEALDEFVNWIIVTLELIPPD